MAKSKKDTSKQNMPIGIKDNLTIYQAADLREKLLAVVEANQEIIIDLHELKDWDVAGLQLLVALRKTAAKSGKNLRLEQAPDAFFEAFDAIGLSRKKNS